MPEDCYTAVEKDYQIMDILRRNPRATLAEIRKEVGMSPSVIHFRMKRIRRHFDFRGEFYKKTPEQEGKVGHKDRT